MNIRIIIYLTLLFIPCVISHAREIEHEIAPIQYELLPGGTHFYYGDFRKGTAFITSELSLLSAGILLHKRLEDDDKNELNIPLILAGQIYTVDKCDYYRNRLAIFFREHAHEKHYIQCDTTSLYKLTTAPFSREVFLSKFVITWAILGILDGIVSYPENSRGYRDITRVNMFDHYMSRKNGTAAYISSAGAVSLGAAVSEEMLFRGILLPILDYKFGQRTGLITSSLGFGLLHLFNPDIDRPLYFISQATAAGFAFGYHVQRNSYSIKKVIAAHFWYNIISMTTTWITNPEENPLGISVFFKL